MADNARLKELFEQSQLLSAKMRELGAIVQNPDMQLELKDFQKFMWECYDISSSLYLWSHDVIEAYGIDPQAALSRVR